MLSLLPLLFVVPRGEPVIGQDDWVTFGEVQVFGQTDPDGRKEPARTVQLKFPKSISEPVDVTGPGFDYAGGRLLLNEWGNLGRVHWGSGWDEFRAMREKAQQKIAAGSSVPWKVRVYIITRADLLRKDRNGVLVIQDDVMFDPDINLILESFVRTEALVEAFTEGAVDVQIDYGIERVPLVEEYPTAAITFAPEEASHDFYSARFNTGDYDSVMTVYTLAESDTNDAGMTRGKTNGAVQSTVLYSNGRERNGNLWHTQLFMQEFLEGVRVSAFDWGYGAEYAPLLPAASAGRSNGFALDGGGYPQTFAWLRDYTRAVVGPPMWQKVRNRVSPDYAAAHGLMKAYDGQLKRWSDVAADPWAGLPLITPQDLAARIGATSIAVQEREANVLFLPEGGQYRTPMKAAIDLRDVMLNNQLNLDREGIARIGYADRDLLVVRWDLADFVVRRLGDHAAGTPPPANVVGILKVGERPFVVIDTNLSNDTLAEANLIGPNDGKASATVLTKGVIEVGDRVPVRFASDVPDVRFTVTGLDGAGLTVSNGELQVSTQTPGTRIYKAVAALPSGERVERPFVVRVVEPVTIDEFRYYLGNLVATVTNNGPERTVTAELQLPSGWTHAQRLPRTLGAYQTEFINFDVGFPSGKFGSGGATFSIGAAGRQAATARTALVDSGGQDLVHNTFEGGPEGWNVWRRDSGTYTAEVAQDSERGSVLAVRDGGGARFGKVNAYGRVLEDGSEDRGFGGYSVEDYPFVNFMLKSDGKAPLALTVVVNGRRFVAPITGVPEDVGTGQVWLDRVKFTPNGTWQQVSFNLAEALPGSERRRFVTEITFGDPKLNAENYYRSERVNTHWIDDFKISAVAAVNAATADADEEVEPIGDLASADPYLRALGAANATGTAQEMEAIRKLIRDEDNLVRTNAAAVLGRIKDAASVAALVEAALMERVPYPALMMVRALAFQDTPETWGALKAIVRQGRAEELSVAEAAKLMALTQNVSHIEDLSILLTGRNWSTRKAGAGALGSLPSDQAGLMLLTYLLEVDPMVRMTVARSARQDVELVARRMEWASVNDLSNTVRGHSFAALTRSTDALRRSRGYAGLKEDDPEIRRIIAEELRRWPMDGHVTPLLGLLSDPAPMVRAAAVGSLFAMPGTRSFSEMSVLAGENDDWVLYHLLDAALQKKIELPRSMLERLATHRNPLVRDRVKELM